MELKRGYKQSEMGVIPEDWELWPVRRMGDVVTGKALAAHAPGLQRPYLRTKNVFDGRIDVSDVLSMPMTDEQFTHFEVRPGDLLLNEGQSLELVGRCAMYRGEFPGRCAIQNQLLRFRAKPGVSADFACQLFRHCQHTGVFARVALQTTSIAHLGGTRFERLCLAWPQTEDEQCKIGTALSDVDALLDGLDRLLVKKRDLKQASMQQLLTGRTRLPGFAAPWQPQALSHAGKCLRGVTYDSATDLVVHDTEITHRLLRANNVQGSTVNIDDVQYVRSQRVKPEQELRPLDVLICMANGSKTLVGKAGLFQIADGFRYTFGAFMGCFRVDASVADPRFIFYLFQTDQYRHYINLLLAGSSINNLRPSSIESLEFQIPKPTEQTAIADVISDMDAEIAALEARRDKARLIKQGMMQELLTGRTRLIDTKGAIA